MEYCNISYSETQNIEQMVLKTKKYFGQDITKSISQRKRQLEQLIIMLNKESKTIKCILNMCMKQPEFLAELGPISRIKESANNALKNLNLQTSYSKRSVPVTVRPGSTAFTIHEPLGVVLIFGVWNFPFITTLCPMIGAIAAGNCVVLKPSEISDPASGFLLKMIPKYLDSDAIKVVHGGVEQATTLLEQKFDKIFYTGNGHVGRIVLKAASRHLTPVTLELGGKNPAIVSKNAKIDLAAKRILQGKLQNMGQACVAPDYVLVDKEVCKEFCNSLKKWLKTFFGFNLNKSKDISRIINSNHTRRLSKLIDSENKTNIISGGNYDIEDCYIEPTIVLTDLNSLLMKDEIFGPILVIIESENFVQSINQILTRDKPLALYIFSESKAEINSCIRRTSAGTMCVNDTMMQATCLDMPFGGVGGSGMGNYHGKYTFECFSHEKSVLERSTWIDPSLRYPPYTNSKRKLIVSLVKATKFASDIFENFVPENKTFFFGFFLVFLFAILWANNFVTIKQG